MIPERTAELQLIYNRYLKPEPSAAPEKKASRATPALALSDDEIIQKAHAAKNCNTFAALWNGDTVGFNSPSKADLSLCNMLAFWTQREADQMDRLFRLSGLYREKWNRRQTGSTYGALTIQKAIASCRETYSPRTWDRVPKQDMPTGVRAHDPHEHKHGASFKAAPGAVLESVKPSDFTDTGNARIYAGEYEKDVIYTTADGFLVWDGKRWDENELEAAGLAMKLTDKMLDEARAEIKVAGDALTSAKVSEDSDAIENAKQQVAAAEAYRKHAYASRNQPKIASMLKLSRTLMQVKPNKLNANPYLLNTPTGMVELKTKQIAPHDPKELCTKITMCGPGTKGAEIWQEFLATISGGDEKMINFLQQIAGMAAVGKVFEENLVIAIGDGKNGKSAFFNALAIVLNDYAGTISAETLTTAGRSKGAELATLKGKRLIIAAETEEGARLSASMLKQIASTDKIHAERKYKDPVDFMPSHSTILYTNHAPKIGSTDTGTWRRLVMIPFDAKIAEGKEAKNYADVLATEAGEAILSWIIEGAHNYISIGHKLVIPDFVHEAIEKYQNENDWMADFLQEFCEVGQGRTVKARMLYTTYHDWAIETSSYARHSKDFAAELEKRGFQQRRTNAGILWHGVNLLPQECGYSNRDFG